MALYAIHHKLGPELALDVVGNPDRDAGLAKTLCDALKLRTAVILAVRLPRLADDQIAAAAVSDASRGADGGGDIDHRGDESLVDVRSHPLDVIDAVLQTQNDGVAREVRRDGASGLLGVAGFDAEQNPPGVPDSGGVDRGG
jgi:hypothetical protein